MKSWHDMNVQEKIEWLSYYPANGLKDEISVRKPSAYILWKAYVRTTATMRKKAAKILMKYPLRIRRRLWMHTPVESNGI
jgi:hypothetical protein